jgi:prepilin-type N-terminal cleavage/methylation domain-containing protein
VSPRPTPRPRRAEGGFSLIEIMIAVTVFLIAVAGLLAMLFTSMRANASAAEGTNAVGIAEGFLEEVRLRQMGWTGSAAIAVQAPELAVDLDVWHAPALGTWAGTEPRDLQGRAMDTTGARKAIYCVSYRVHQDQGLAIADADEARVLVRVAFTADGSEAWADCAPETVAAALELGGNARAVILSALIRRNP